MQIGDDAVTVVDTFWDVGAAKRLLEEIRKRTSLPVRFVINSHYHVDHVAGNSIFRDAGATVLAQRNVRGWIHTENLRLLGSFLTPELKALIEATPPPSVVYDQGVNLYLGTREIQVRSFPGHTGGDSIVLIPGSRIAFLGDLFWHNMLPNLIDASTQPWIETLDTILAMNGSGYTFVPRRGKSGDALAQSVMPRLKEKHGHWEFAEPLAKDNLLQTDAELNGTKRIPEVQRGG